MKKTINSVVKSMVNNKEWLVDALSTATYDSFWARFGVHMDTPKDIYENAKSNNDCCEEVWADVLLNGGYFLVEDLEENKDYKLSLKDFEKGMKTLIVLYPQMYVNIKTDNADYYDYDALLQCAIFGDIIYG